MSSESSAGFGFIYMMRRIGDALLHLENPLCRLAMPFAAAYEIQTSTDNGVTWVHAATPTKTHFQLTGLTPGQLYQIRVRAVGGSTGYGDWSDAVSHRST
ncbi:MAG TPA: fibronectin type III domain-containing protein [Verrucomicrobiae bacterium]|nr:fibronectin type III domain-containing protein [Verrucomicrobiae bacterium]